MAASPPALVVEDMHKSFGKLEVLRGLGIEARKGDVIAILGASGSGKSTFLRCINLLERPNRGRITVAGEELKLKAARDGAMDAADPRQLQRVRSRLGMVFQQFNLWAHMTVLQNVVEAPIQVLGLGKREAHDRADALLRKVGLYERRDYFPAHLSGGQQQRAAIARALAMEPAVLLFDEPTSALDPELVREVLEVMRALAAEGRTMLVVTHEMSFARDVAGEVLFLHQGVIDCQGAPPAMFGAPPTERFDKFLAGARHA